MPDISKIDKNFAVNTNIQKDNLRFYDVENEPFSIYGVFKENGIFRRMPEAISKSVSDGVNTLCEHAAGGRVRFATDSSYIVINAEMKYMSRMPHFAFTGSMGFDLYVGDSYMKTFVPPIDREHGYEGIAELGTKEMREITINFPLYSPVNKLYIGLEDGAVIERGAAYANERPIVYYGSSITQGGCASRPGMSYQSIISRKFNYDYINLGFSGNAKGEDEMAEYIKGLDMSIFVYDYDHNAPTVEHLKSTHEKMFLTIREAHPELPVIMMPRPKLCLSDAEKKRFDIIYTTYQNALARGDKNVYFIDNLALTALCGNEGTVDGCHPTDFGFASMAAALCNVIEKLEIV